MVKGFDRNANVLKQNLEAAKKPRDELFDASQGGGVEGTFEYVANYLWAEVPDEARKQLWDQVWDYTVVGTQVKLVPKPDLRFGRRRFLSSLIASGLVVHKPYAAADPNLKAAWEPVSARAISEKIKVVEPAKGDYGREPLGIGFHTTDGGPDKVLESKSAGGWGGILQTMNVPFFRKRYALDAAWNPLGRYLAENGPAYRRRVQDNELLSTVSVATDSHATLRFPLWTPLKTGTETTNRNGQRSFKMEAWMYVVAVREAYATYQQQDNPFGEIAVAKILPTDVIGWCKLTRWHDYDQYPNQVATADFYYDLGRFHRNPEFGKDAFKDKVFAAAEASVTNERAAAKEKHTSAK